MREEFSRKTKAEAFRRSDQCARCRWPRPKRRLKSRGFQRNHERDADNTMATVTLDTITYAAMRDAFADAPQGRPVNRGYISIDLDGEEIAALESEQLDGETLPETIMRVSTNIRKAA